MTKLKGKDFYEAPKPKKEPAPIVTALDPSMLCVECGVFGPWGERINIDDVPTDLRYCEKHVPIHLRYSGSWPKE